MSEKKHILLCVAGGTPQIITETLWALRERGERVDEIRVITTLTGREKIRALLLDPQAGRWPTFRRDYPEAGAIRFDETLLYLLTNKPGGVPDVRDTDDARLADILTSADNERAANQIAAIVRHLTHDENIRLHASVAGGRKTMGLYLQAAMQLFGRPDDAMSHVLVNNEIEGRAANFFYRRPQPEPLVTWQGGPLLRQGRQLTSHDAEIYLADIPFIRLRGIGSRWLADYSAGSFGETVEQANADLRFLEEAKDLRLCLKDKTLRAANREVKLSLREFFVFALFAHLRRAGQGRIGFVSFKKIGAEQLETVCRLISRAKGDEVGLDNFASLPRADFIGKLNVAALRAKTGLSLPEALEKVADTYRQVLGKITPKLAQAKMDKFDITRQGEKEAYVFGLDLPPHRIKFE